MYQLIIFDWDGTLMDSAQKIANCIRASARDLGLNEPTDAAAKSIIGLGLTQAMEILFPDISTDQIARVVEAYKHHFVSGDLTEQALFEGVEQGLTTIEESGALIAVATGKSRAGLNRVFEDLKMEHYFVATRCADETRGKPHPQMLLELLDYTAIDPTKSIMVGDTTYDLDMAANAGMHGLGASYGVHSQQALWDAKAINVLDSFKDIVSWLSDGRLEKAYC